MRHLIGKTFGGNLRPFWFVFYSSGAFFLLLEIWRLKIYLLSFAIRNFSVFSSGNYIIQLTERPQETTTCRCREKLLMFLWPCWRYFKRVSKPTTHSTCALFSNQKSIEKVTVVKMRKRNQAKPKSSAQSYVRDCFCTNGILSKWNAGAVIRVQNWLDIKA